MKYRYADAHCDTAYEMLFNDNFLDENNLHVSLSQTKKFDSYLQVFAVWTSDKFCGIHRTQAFYEITENLKKEIKQRQEKICLCRCGNDIKAAITDGKIAALLAVEGGGALNGNLDEIYNMHETGVRMFTLTWNGANELGCGQPLNSGLTHFGKEALAVLEEMGILVDVSHLSDKGFFDVASLAKRPFLASHSNLRSVCPHKRNLTDDQFKGIVERGGVCGVNLCPLFLSIDGIADFESVERHIDGFLTLGGENNIVIGADFDGINDLPYGITGLESIPLLMDYFLARGYGEGLVDKIFYKNLSDFLCRTLTNP